MPSTEHKRSLATLVSKVLFKRFKRFGHHLEKGLFALLGCVTDAFLQERSVTHLRRILATHYFLRKKVMEGPQKEKVCVRLFFQSDVLCLAVLSHSAPHFSEKRILNAAQTQLAGLHLVPQSFCSWQDQEGVSFYYLELEKLRGEQLDTPGRKFLEETLKDSLLNIPEAFFSPYNHEESYKMVIQLQKELEVKGDLPHVSIHFRGKSGSKLEFLIHVASIEKAPWEGSFETIFPERLTPLFHFRSEFPKGVAVVFSLFLPAEVEEGVNLLKARESIVAILEEILGAFRDYNGGLLYKQKEVFSALRGACEKEVPHFNLFAEPLFYSIEPIEKRITLTPEEAKILFAAFSKAFSARAAPCLFKEKSGLFVAKTPQKLSCHHKNKDSLFSLLVHLDIGGNHYTLCQPKQKLSEEKLKTLFGISREGKRATKCLRLAFQEGAVPSLNPYFLAPDLRCRTVFRALFEGLTRLTHEGRALLAGAKSFTCSPDQKHYRFVLRDNRWSNGEQVTAYHYQNGWQQGCFSLIDNDPKPYILLKNGGKILRGELPAEALGVHAKSEMVLEIELEHPDPYFLQRLAQPLFFPLIHHVGEPKVFNGPFELISQNASGLVMEKSPHFWNRSACSLDRIEIQYIDQFDKISQSFRQNKLDWIGDPFACIPKDKAPSFALEQAPTCRPLWLYLNASSPLLRSKRVRQALDCLLDREVVANFFPAKAKVTHNPYDPKRAQHLFELELQENQAACSPLSFLVYAGKQGGVALAEYAKAECKKWLNLDISICAIKNWNTYYHQLQSMRFDICECYVSVYTEDPVELLERFEILSPLNYSKWYNTHYQAALAKSRAALSQKEREQAIATAKKIFFEEVPAIDLIRRPHLSTHAPNLSGYSLDASGGVDFCYAKMR